MNFQLRTLADRLNHTGAFHEYEAVHPMHLTEPSP